MVYFIICAVVAFAAFSVISVKFRLNEKQYNSKKISHNALLVIAVGVCGFLSFWIFHLLYKEGITYPFKYGLEYYSPYEQLFDAFMKRQLHLDVIPSNELIGMANPYDTDLRNSLGVDYLWDRAFFNGHYYCYFGPAPVLLVYFPFYLLTKTLPSPQTACFIMSILTIPVIAALTVKAQKLFVKKVNPVLLVLSVLCVEAGSLVLTVQSSADFYYTAVQSGILFLSLFLLTTLTAYEKKTLKGKSLFFALSGVSLVFLILSRPNMALFALTAVPVYLNVLLSKDFSIKKKAVQVMAFFIPTCIGAAVVMWYNYARFGSVFEFGASYQLTVHDVNDYSLTLSLLFPTVYYYFIKQPEITAELPYLKIDFVNVISESYKKYIYLTSTIGSFSLPCNWAVLTAVPLYTGEKNRVKQGFVFSGAACIFVLAFFDTCMGGVNIRYLADIMLVLTLISVIILCDLVDGVSDSKRLSKVFFLAAVFILLLSIAVGALLILNNERDYIIELFKKQGNL